MATKSVGHRDCTHQDLMEALNRLLGSVEAQSRSGKVETELAHATKSFDFFGLSMKLSLLVLRTHRLLRMKHFCAPPKMLLIRLPLKLANT